MNIKLQKNKGISLVEILLYVAIFTVMSIVIINSMITMTKAFAETSVKSDFIQSSNILERMSREIRKSIGINTFATSDLKLNTTDSTGAAKTIEFKVVGTDLQLLDSSVNSGSPINLNPTHIQVSSLVFTQITTPKGSAVKIILSVQDTKDKTLKTETFYNTIALRGNY